jgi:o-succinylbenzoate synthase
LRIESIHLRPYRLPLKQPWRAASATIGTRMGMLVRADGEGASGWGDCAPLPSSGGEGHARAFAALQRGAARLRQLDAEEAFGALPEVASAEARWALEMALLDLSMRLRGLPLRHALRSGAPDALKVNAALGPLDALCAERAAAALEQGFAVAKIKVGLDSPEVEAGRLVELSRRVEGRLRLRLDANRAWRDDEATCFFDAIADAPIDGVEEPLAEPSLERLAVQQKRVPFALAIDESLFDLGPERIFTARAVRRLVLKPARVGGFGASMRLAERAARAGMEVVATSVVESAIGVAATAQLAAALDGDAVHGLATGSWLREDVAEPLKIAGGRIVLPAGAGLGLAPERQSA